MTPRSIASYLGKFLEIRLRAFVYACFWLVGVIMGVMLCYEVSLGYIGQYEAATKAAIVMKYGL